MQSTRLPARLVRVVSGLKCDEGGVAKAANLIARTTVVRDDVVAPRRHPNQPNRHVVAELIADALLERLLGVASFLIAQ